MVQNDQEEVVKGVVQLFFLNFENFLIAKVVIEQQYNNNLEKISK